jgi:hypothetical protein
MMRWSKAVVPFSTIAVPEAMLEILPLAAVFTTCIQGLGISGAIRHHYMLTVLTSPGTGTRQ